MKKQKTDIGYIYPGTNARGLNFGQALEEAKRGRKISREGWNGKDQYVFLAHAVDFDTDADISEFEADPSIVVGDMLVIRTTAKVLQPGWLASQADMLAEDWYIYAE